MFYDLCSTIIYCVVPVLCYGLCLTIIDYCVVPVLFYGLCLTIIDY